MLKRMELFLFQCIGPGCFKFVKKRRKQGWNTESYHSSYCNGKFYVNVSVEELVKEKTISEMAGYDKEIYIKPTVTRSA